MATSAEKTELVETLKGPKYYRIMLWGYGGESAYLGLTKEQYEFWKSKDEENYDTTLNYMLDEEREEFTDIPVEMDFMGDPDDTEAARYSWHDAPGEFCHQWGVAWDSARITVTEIESDEYSADPIQDVVDGEELQELLNKLDEEHNYELDLTEMSVAEGTDEQPPYVLQFYSSEKGTFFEGIFESIGPFDIKRLKVFCEEFPNGEDIVTNITYDGRDIENQGGDTNGKGYSVHLWANE
jgi:hypothetical protein